MSGISKRVSGSWVSGDYGIMKTATDTITTLPAIIYPNDTTATVGLKGNMEQSGTPTPDNPIMQQGTGERTGNLIDVQPFTIESDSASHNVVLWSGTLPTGTYTISLNQDDTLTSALRNTIRLVIGGTSYYESVTENYHLQSGRHKMTFTISDSSQSVEIRYWGNTFDNECSYSNIMLNLGETALPYEPWGIKIPISSASTTTPVYLGEVQSTRQIKKLVLTGEENLNYSAESYGYCYTLINSTTFPINNSFCSHFKNSGYTGSSRSTGRESLGNEEFICVRTSTNIYFRYDSVSDANEFKAYLAQQYANGTPVTVWYVLATPTTGIVNEPLRKIEEYADTVSGITIPTITGANSFDVLTTLKPSEVTVNYKGWHPVQSVHERENGAWT